MTLSPWTAKLREWQARAVSSVLTHALPDFLATATPAAGKTRFALRIAHQYLADRVASRVLVICPTNHLRTQWSTAAGLVGAAMLSTLIFPFIGLALRRRAPGPAPELQGPDDAGLGGADLASV